MALPYVQVDSDFIKRKAVTIAAMLKIPRQMVVGMGNDLFDYIVEETATDTRPPDGVLLDPDAPDIIEAVMEWAGERGKAFNAFVRAGVVERLEVGARVKGCERYRATWEKNKRRKPDGNRTVTGEKPDGTGPESKRNSKSKTEKELLPTEVVSKAAAVAPLVYEAPQKPEAEWVGQDFFVWAQSRRIASGLLGEKWPRPEKLRDFWLSVSHARVSVRRLQEAFYRYGADPWWERPDVKPAHPWSGFQSQWEKYVPQEQAA